MRFSANKMQTFARAIHGDLSLMCWRRGVSENFLRRVKLKFLILRVDGHQRIRTHRSNRHCRSRLAFDWQRFKKRAPKINLHENRICPMYHIYILRRENESDIRTKRKYEITRVNMCVRRARELMALFPFAI